MAEISTVPRKFISLLDSFISGKSTYLESESRETKTVEDYFERVESYSTYTWLAKPPALSPLQCARYGWKNVDVDRLKCVTCSATLTVTLPSASYNQQQYKEMIETFVNELRTRHNSLCPWKDAPVPEELIQLPSSYPEFVPILRRRLKSYSTDLHLLPKLELNTVLKVLLSHQKAVDKLKDVLDCQAILPGIDEEIQLAACTLVFCGWEVRCSNKLKSSLLICSICRRRVGIWNYILMTSDTTDDKLELSSDSIEERSSSISPAKRRKSDKKEFNPLKAHRYWCPYFLTDDSTASGQNIINDLKSMDDHHDVGLKYMLNFLVPKSRIDPTDQDLNSVSPEEVLEKVQKTLKNCRSSKLR